MTKRLVFLYDSTIKPWHADIERIRVLLAQAETKGAESQVLDVKDMSPDEVAKWREQAYACAVRYHQRIRRVFGSRRHGGLSFFGKHVPALLVYEADEDHVSAVYPHETKDREEISIETFLRDVLDSIQE